MSIVSEDISGGQIYNVTDCGIGIFDGFLSDYQTDFFIDYFNKTLETGLGTVWSHSAGKDVADDTRVTIWPPDDKGQVIRPIEQIQTSGSHIKLINDALYNLVLPKYMDKMKGLKQYSFSIDSFKVQRTKPGEGYHAWHTEAANVKLLHRIFAISIYLNDVEEGGETEFLCQGKRVEPRKGRILIFPAGYTHEHRGNPPLKGEKYLMNGWGTYI